ncbi:MAG: DUF6156 family protein [Methylococcaceae bacterium]|nr:DUF6156 family protein [Methylococcaceae bacterium]
MSDAVADKYRYFVTYSGVKLPLNLLNELEPEQLGNRNTFFRGQFDAQDRLIGIQKLVYGEIEMEHRYTYDDGGVLKRAEITDADGELTAMDFEA